MRVGAVRVRACGGGACARWVVRARAVVVRARACAHTVGGLCTCMCACVRVRTRALGGACLCAYGASRVPVRWMVRACSRSVNVACACVGGACFCVWAYGEWMVRACVKGGACPCACGACGAWHVSVPVLCLRRAILMGGAWCVRVHVWCALWVVRARARLAGRGGEPALRLGVDAQLRRGKPRVRAAAAAPLLCRPAGPPPHARTLTHTHARLHSPHERACTHARTHARTLTHSLLHTPLLRHSHA